DIEDAIRQARFARELRQPQQSERGDLRRLDDDGIAGSKRRRHLPGANHHREIPRHDDRDDAKGLAMDEAQYIVAGGCYLAIELVDRLAIVAEGAGSRERLGLDRQADLGAIVAYTEHGELDRMLLDEIGELEENLLALRRCGARPGALLEGMPRRLYRAI